jgi:Ca2+-dependent lipid-binding protein
MSNGVFEVTVIEGRNLKNKDSQSKIDSFIELYLDKDYKQRTTTNKNTSTPLWHEVFRL